MQNETFGPQDVPGVETFHVGGLPNTPNRHNTTHYRSWSAELAADVAEVQQEASPSVIDSASTEPIPLVPPAQPDRIIPAVTPQITAGEVAKGYFPKGERFPRIRRAVAVAHAALMRVISDPSKPYPDPQVIESSNLSIEEKERRLQQLMQGSSYFESNPRPRLPEDRRLGSLEVGGVPTTQPGARLVRTQSGGYQRPDIRPFNW